MNNTPPTKNKPISEFKDEGAIKAVVWKNEGKNGSYNTTEFYRNVPDGNGGYKQVTSIRDQDLPQLEEVIKQVKENNRELRKQYRQELLNTHAPSGNNQSTYSHHHTQGSHSVPEHNPDTNR